MKRITKIILSVILLLLLLGFLGFLITKRTQSQVKDLFRLNATLQEEGYYMADFEFKLMGIVYYLDRGKYGRALSHLSSYHAQLKERKDLIKIPEFKTKSEELEFYLSLQNPRTGAFMDDAYPYCTFHGPTENVIAHLDLLAKETGRHLKLKYPLRYLDEINSPAKITAYLEDVSHIGFIGRKLPQTTYVFARDLLSYLNESLIVKDSMYSFTPEVRKTLIEWFYNDQDSVTGFWGPRSKNGKLIKADLTNTASVIKTFVNTDGKNISEDYPLRYSTGMIENALKVLSQPVPGDDDRDELHEWNLSMGKGIYMILRYLWNYATEEQKEEAKSIIENYLRIKFQKYYVPDDGAFSYYPGEGHASLDGTGGACSLLKEVGAFSADKQNHLWGYPWKNIIDHGKFRISEIRTEELAMITADKAVNSLRVYRELPDSGNLSRGVIAVIYPGKESYPDIMELIPEVDRWLDKQSLTIGNWTSREEIRNNYTSFEIKDIPVYKELNTDRLNKILSGEGELHLIGFDILQIPRCKISWIRAVPKEAFRLQSRSFPQSREANKIRKP